jgi:pimeloyl-ACP methyl ester carboxylesterase
MSTNTARPGHYFRVNGLDMYYEAYGGTGRPLVLLHGGITTIETSFGTLLPALTPHRRVIAVEQQGHGRTADIDRPMSFPQMADDTAALLRHLGVEDADVFGYSDGGNVGLGLAIRHPRLVAKLVLGGTNYNNDGLLPGLVEMFKSINPDDLVPFKDVYQSVAPRPEDWPRLVRKVMAMAVGFPGWPPEALQALRAHTLIMIGDADIVTPEHAVEMFRLIPNARLAVLPNTDHFLRMRPDPAWVVALLDDFLNAPLPEGQTAKG